MATRVGIVTEGPASRAVLEEICRRRGVSHRVRNSEGKDQLFRKFHKILRFIDSTRRPRRMLVVPDLHPETDCIADAEKWTRRIAELYPTAKLCLSIWETEQWLLADQDAARAFLGMNVTTPKDDYIGGVKPSEWLDDACKRARGYKGSFDKRVDGKTIAAQMDLQTARLNSPSLDRFLRLL